LEFAQYPAATLSGSAIDTLVRIARVLCPTTPALRQARQAGLIELGAAFIKLGQFLSVRKDIISDELAEELMELQDRVPPFEFELPKARSSASWAPRRMLFFRDFELTPIASASIGQVHRAGCRCRPVVVKVQGPTWPRFLSRSWL